MNSVPHHLPVPHRGWLVLLLAWSLHAAAWGQATVDFDFPDREAWVGQPISLAIEVVDAAEHDPPVLTPADGARLELLEQTSERQMTQIINGRMSRRSTIVYTVRIIPERAGVIEIPPIAVAADGRTFRSRPWRLSARKSEVGDLMSVRIVGTPSEAWIGEPVTLILEIKVKQYRNREFGIALDAGGMWDLVDKSASNWGIFLDPLQAMMQQRRSPRVREVDEDGIPHFVFEIPIVRHPIEAGTIEAGDVRIVAIHPTSIATKPDLLGRRSVTMIDSRPIVVEAEGTDVVVKDLPIEGRPEGFTGAVGEFRIRALASPTEMSVGDPITLILEVTDMGTGAPIDLANLRPPDLRADPALDGFRVPETPTTGVTEGRTKVFTETLRPERDDLGEIPGISFSSFDPRTASYVTQRTKPISITVRPSERLDLSSAVLGGLETPDQIGSELTTIDGVIRSNRGVPSTIGGVRPPTLGWPILLAVVAPPVVFAAATIVRSRRRHLSLNPHLIRASTARRTALDRLHSEGPVADRVHQSLTGLVAARLHQVDGALTAPETVASTVAAGLDDAGAAELSSLLAAAEAARYAPGDASEDERLLSRAEALVPVLDRLRPVPENRR